VKNNNRIRTVVNHFVLIALLTIWVDRAVPEFNCDGFSDAKLCNLTTNLQTIRAQLELYSMHHDEKYPTDITAQLTSRTDADGTISQSGAFGPYVQEFPANPYVDDQAKAANTSGEDAGWCYTPGTGAFTANTVGHKGY